MKLKIHLPSQTGNRGAGAGSSAGATDGLGASASDSTGPAAARPKRAQSQASLGDDDEVVFLSEGNEAAAAPAKPKRTRKRVKLEQTASVGDREDDAQDAADELMAPPAAVTKAEAKKRARKPSGKVPRCPCSCLPSLLATLARLRGLACQL